MELSAEAGVPLDRGFASFEDRLIGLSEDPQLARFSAAIDRDVNIPRAMVKALGHALCRVYAEVVAAGRVAWATLSNWLRSGSSPWI
jgi:hypothetical protein